jgi:hypothetical protein
MLYEDAGVQRHNLDMSLLLFTNFFRCTTNNVQFGSSPIDRPLMFCFHILLRPVSTFFTVFPLKKKQVAADPSPEGRHS